MMEAESKKEASKKGERHSHGRRQDGEEEKDDRILWEAERSGGHKGR